MTSIESISARVSMIIHAAEGDIISAFVVRETLTQFWLPSCSAPLDIGATVHWEFMVPARQSTQPRPDCSRAALSAGNGQTGRPSKSTLRRRTVPAR